ncbi:hypothetical protein YYE_00648 [Plasmodium vinckei vinckei]|nr:hypothetical protein YYE_00648 [Plasmodium vinckei vinckei]
MNELEKYKRQISLWGKEHQDILMSSCVCFLGSDLIIFEICKGLLLSGVHNLTIIDDQKVGENDLKYYMLNNSSKLHKYKCNIIKENLININKNANIKCVINNPIDYFYNNIMNDNNYDILICNLSVKNNLKIEKVCRKYNKKIITCNVTNVIGYLNIRIGKHIYMGKKQPNKLSCNDSTYSFSYYYNIALSLYDDLKEYINDVDYLNFQTNNELSKILFLAKIYHNFSYEINETIRSEKIIKCVKDKIKLTNISYGNLNKVDYFIYLLNIKKRIKFILQNNNYITNEGCNNHIYLFLIIYKSFIKKKKYMPYLYNGNNDGSKNVEPFRGINEIKTILKKRKYEDEKEIKFLIIKKKKKYNFKKDFEISHFVYLFSNFFYINFVDSEERVNKNQTLMENFLYFYYLHSVSCNHDNSLGSSLNDNGDCSSDGLREEHSLASSELLLCNDKKDLLNFGRHTHFNNIKKGEVEEEVVKQNCNDKDGTFLFFKMDNQKLRSMSYIDVNVNTLLEKIKISNKLFEDLDKLKHVSSNYLTTIMSGLITQEVIKICSIYLKPHINYYFIKTSSLQFMHR